MAVNTGKFIKANNKVTQKENKCKQDRVGTVINWELGKRFGVYYLINWYQYKREIKIKEYNVLRI